MVILKYCELREDLNCSACNSGPIPGMTVHSTPLRAIFVYFGHEWLLSASELSLSHEEGLLWWQDAYWAIHKHCYIIYIYIHIPICAILSYTFCLYLIIIRLLADGCLVWPRYGWHSYNSPMLITASMYFWQEDVPVSLKICQEMLMNGCSLQWWNHLFLHIHLYCEHRRHFAIQRTSIIRYSY